MSPRPSKQWLTRHELSAGGVDVCRMSQSSAQTSENESPRQRQLSAHVCPERTHNARFQHEPRFLEMKVKVTLGFENPSQLKHVIRLGSIYNVC